MNLGTHEKLLREDKKRWSPQVVIHLLIIIIPFFERVSPCTCICTHTHMLAVYKQWEKTRGKQSCTTHECAIYHMVRAQIRAPSKHTQIGESVIQFLTCSYKPLEVTRFHFIHTH